MLFIAMIDLLAVGFVLPYAFNIKLVIGLDGEARCNETWSGSVR